MDFSRNVLSAALALLNLPAAAAAGWNVFDAAIPKTFTGLSAQGDSVWAAADSGIYVSGDAGKSWSGPGSGLGPGRPIYLAKGIGSLNAVQGRYLYASKDGGRSWTAVDSVAMGEFARIEAWDDTIITWYSIYPNNVPNGSRISTDGGTTWSGTLDIRAYPPASRVYRDDTLAIDGSALAIWETDGYREAYRFPDPIEALAAGRDRIFALTGKHLLAAEAPEGPWKALIVGLQPADIRAVAADSDRIAILALDGVHVSRNRGRDWEFLHSPFAAPEDQRLFMTRSALFLSWNPARRLGNWAPRRYSFASDSWDSLPSGQYFFAAAGTTMIGTQNGGGAWNLAVSTDSAPEFRIIAPNPDHGLSFQSLLAVGRAGFAYSNLNTNSDWYSPGVGTTWAEMKGCGMGIVRKEMIMTDSGMVHLTKSNQLLRRKLDPCGTTDTLPLPEGFSASQRLTIGSWDGQRLVLAGPGRIAVWEESGPTPLVRKAAVARPRAGTRPPLPVRAWLPPGEPPSSGRWIDALGAIRP